MKKKTKIMIAGSLVGMLAIAGGVFYYTNMYAHDNQVVLAQPQVSQVNGQPVKSFTITAEAQKIKLKDGTTVDAWTYGGSAPGNEIRVTQGDKVRVTLKNDLPVPTSIHWHGYPVPNTMDGVPNVTQDAVQPGQSFTYEFTATTPGTYWYHSHQDSAEQEDKGLYGSFIVEPKNQVVKYDQDVTLVLDEWMTGNSMSGMDHGGMNMGSMNMGGMKMSGMKMSGMNMSNDSKNADPHELMMKQMYNVFTVNGTAGDSIKPIQVKAGERVKLRLINAGFQTHLMHLNNQEFKVTDTDGQPLQQPPTVANQLVAIAPGERYDLEFTAGKTGFWIDDLNDAPAAKDIKIPVRVTNGSNPDYQAVVQKLPTLDLTAYGKKTQPFDHKFNEEYTMVLNNSVDRSGESVYTINGQTFPNTKPLTVKKGDWVKVTFINKGTSDHPMHLHGHSFQVRSKNGQPVQEDLEKDTLNVRPGETYEVAFQANNEGNWMFHCHDLHHAAAGMMNVLKYDDYKSPYTPNASTQNNGE